MNIDNQRNEARLFIKRNTIGVCATKIKIVLASAKFFEATCKIRTAEENKLLKDAIHDKDMHSIFHAFRGNTTRYTIHGTKAFWNLIDAIGFFDAATGSQWRYMTQEHRCRNLLWASDLAGQV